MPTKQVTHRDVWVYRHVRRRDLYLILNADAHPRLLTIDGIGSVGAIEWEAVKQLTLRTGEPWIGLDSDKALADLETKGAHVLRVVVEFREIVGPR